MGELLVVGEAEGRVPPTYGVLEVVARARDARSAEAAAQLAAVRCAKVDHELNAARVDPPVVRNIETSSVSSREDVEYGREGRRHRVGWVVERRNRVECAPDADGLTSLIASLTDDGIMLSGPWWRVAPDAEQWDELRAAAARDALRRARAYAEGAGGTIGAVRWIAEPGLRQPADSTLEHTAGRSSRGVVLAAGAGAEDEDGSGPAAILVAVEAVPVQVRIEMAVDLR